MSVFGEAEFTTYQLASGDNLTHHAVVLFGEVAVPEKTVDDLLLRNFSFGFVRLRQLLGMAAFAAVQSLETAADDKRSLYGYFEKIPLNVAKGIRGAAREDIAKERVVEWTRDAIGYEVSGAPGAAAIARAAWATEAIL